MPCGSNFFMLCFRLNTLQFGKVGYKHKRTEVRTLPDFKIKFKKQKGTLIESEDA
jgi:hypothetical protein